MKKLYLMLFCICAMFMCTSCVTAQAYTDYTDNAVSDVAVVDNTCYVYYQNPSTTFLNTLVVVNGTYMYRYNGTLIRVVFPNWYEWSPYRYFYYSGNRWMWRNRVSYNHVEYRRNHHWNDYRMYRSHITQPKRPHQPTIDRMPNRPQLDRRPHGRQFNNHRGDTFRTTPNINSSTREHRGKR